MKVFRRSKQNIVTKSAPAFIFNDFIKDPELTVIDEKGENLGKLSREQALNIAKERELDLVVVSRNGDIIVARIADIAKLKYEKNKKLKKNKGKSSQNKEWWFKPNIQDRDLQIRLDKVKEFLVKGGTAKLTLRGDRKTPYTMMNDTMNKIMTLSGEFAKPLNTITREGRNLSITIKSK